MIPFEDTIRLAAAITAGHRAIVALNDIDHCFTYPLRDTRVVWEQHSDCNQTFVLSLSSAVGLDDPVVSGLLPHSPAQLQALKDLTGACRRVATAASTRA